MKKIYLLGLFILVSVAESCTATKNMESENKTDQAAISDAMESGRFIVKFDRMFTDFGSFIYLRPRSNYIIIDGKKAIISAAYAGRQYDIRLIEGIRINGQAVDYEVNKDSKGRFTISMLVENSQNSFKIYLNVSKNGFASAWVNSLRIDAARYSGYVVPLDRKPADAGKEEAES